MSILRIETAEVFAPLLEPARYKGAHGGRGSGKSHHFAGSIVEDAVRFPGEAGEGLRGICGREIQKSLKDSAKHLIESKLEEHGLGEAHGFKVFDDRIKTPGDGVIVFQGLQDHTSESIKSFEGFHRFWGEEAHTISDRSLSLVRPTIRWESKRLSLASELWFSWNPRRKSDAIDALLRGVSPPTGSVVVRANWSDNPWFPAVLEQERLDDLTNRPELYPHIWEGDYAKVTEGAYFAIDLIRARQQGRIGRVAADPLLPTKFYVDLGGSGAKSDAFAGWICQFVGREIRVLDYYEVTSQPASAHMAWLRERGYTPQTTEVVLPHDGTTNAGPIDATFESAFRSAGYRTEVVPNQGRGAARMRIEAVRRVFGYCWFNEVTTESGREALGAYHERLDTDRQVGLGPEHDWASHGADAFGLMAISYGDGPRARPAAIDRYREADSASTHSWMAV